MATKKTAEAGDTKKKAAAKPAAKPTTAKKAAAPKAEKSEPKAKPVLPVWNLGLGDRPITREDAYDDGI